MIISSIILFHILPILFSINIYKDFLFFIKKNIYKILIFSIPLVYFFNYQLVFTGGGFFYQISHLLFENNYLFYLISLFSVILIWYFAKLSINNCILIFLLIISNIQNTIYHKYYEPMFLIIFFVLFDKINLQLFFKEKNNFIYLYIFSLSYIFFRVFKIMYLIWIGCGGRIWTADLQVMSLTSYQTAPPRGIFKFYF